MAELNKLTLFISAFLVLIVGFVLLGVVADNIWANTVTDTAGNETVNTVASTATLKNNDIIQLTSAYNHTRPFVVGVEVNVTSAGVVTTASNLSSITMYTAYTFYPDNYVKEATSRTLLSMIVLFFALAVVAVGLAMLINIGKGTLF